MTFSEEKHKFLNKIDSSRKGQIDELILDLVSLINEHKQYYTTSSCSGRMILLQQSRFGIKKGVKWLLVSHTNLDPDNVCKLLFAHQKTFHSGSLEVMEKTTMDRKDNKHFISSVKSQNKLLSDETITPFQKGVQNNDLENFHHKTLTSNQIVFKFEPAIIHVCCDGIDAGKLLLSICINCGFKNSGLSISSKGRVILAIRCTLNLEVPLSFGGDIAVSREYIYQLVELANEKMLDNLKRLKVLENKLKELNN